MVFRIILVFTLLTILLSTAPGQPSSYIRVRVERYEELLPLITRGVTFYDVRIYHQKRELGKPDIRWCADNGFVTIAGDSRLAAELQMEGYRVINGGIAELRVLPEISEYILPDQFGWPKTMAGWPGVYGQSTTVDDMNGDGRPEVFLTTIEGYVYGWRYNGTFVPSYPRNPYWRVVGPDSATWITTGSREGGAIGDIDGDGLKEFVFGKDIGFLFSMPYGPGFTPGFPLDLGLAIFSNEPALFDLDNDGRDEIVVVTYPWPTGSASYSPAVVHIYNDDGSELPGWPQQIPVNSESSPVIGDIDGDFQMEIVVGSGRDPNLGIPGRLYAWNLDGTPCAGFPIEVGNSVESTPTLADIDLNGIVDILIRIKPTSTNINGVYAYNGQGQPLPGFPAVIPWGGTQGAPAVADADGDGFPDIAIGTVLAVDSGMVYLFNYDGSLKSGFPKLVYATWVEESVVLADVSGDGLPDVVATTNGLSNDPGKVWAFDYQGQVVDGFPIITEAVVGSSLESTPTVIDIDGDGDTEIFTANWNGKVYCWDSPGLANPDNAWPMFKHNARRTGNHLLVATSIKQEDDIVPPVFELLQNYPNPFNAGTIISFALSRRSPVTIKVYNLLGTELVALLDGVIYEPGRHSVRFNPESLASGIYIYELQAGTEMRRMKMIVLK